MLKHFIAVALFFSALGDARADVLHLANGDRLSGSVKEMKGGKLTLKTSYAGDIAIDWPEIQSLETESALTVRVSSGRAIEGRLASPAQGSLTVGEGESAVELQLAEITGIRPPVREPEELGLLDGWHGAADLGITFNRGNTDVTNLSIAINPFRRTRKDRIGVRFQVLRNTQDGQVASDLYRARFRYDRYLSTRIFVFGQGEFEKDERELLDLRSSQGAGFGVRLWPSSDTQVSVFGGLTFLQEKFLGQERELEAEGIGGFELETVLDRLSFSTKAQILPILSDGRYRFEWDAGVRLPLVANFALGLQVFDYYDSDPPRAGVQRNDFGLLTTLGWAF